MKNSFVLLFVAVFAAAGCNTNDTASYTGPDDTDSGDYGLGQGEDCSGGEACMTGLVCAADGTCQPEGYPGTTAEDGDCVSSDFCQYGLVCASDGTCQQPGDPGTTEFGGSCEEDDDCMLFLECIDGACYGFQPPYWTGGTCEDESTYPADFTAFFEVDSSSPEFYRLPFPNDIRMSGGNIDLTGHANPGVLIPDLGNPVDDYFEMIENDLDGFGTSSCVYFRFSEWLDGDSLSNMENVYIVNIDPASEDYGVKAWSRFRGNSTRGNYICRNWLALCPSLGRPLDPSTTYAAVLTTDITDPDGNALGRDSDFGPMLEASQPSDSAMATAWEAYAPLRDYISDVGLDASEIAVATVFTTGSVPDHIPAMREAVRAEAAPAVTGLATDTTSSDYTLYTGKVSIPFFQDGTRPFKTAADGGAISYDSSGLPIWVEDEDVSFALTVPAGTAPTDGWPVILYAHGTGGSELSFVNNGVASLMASAGAAVIGIEQVQHGDRRGLSSADADLEANSPERLFYNFLNPRAARDNNVQAAADYFQLVRLVEDFDTITGEAVLFDQANIFFYGHSQGSQGPFLFAAHELQVRGILISGAGGYLIESFLGKENPVNVSALITLALMEFDVDFAHPLLNLMQTGFDSVDPMNHAEAVAQTTWAPETYPNRHVFMSYGIGDTYTPYLTAEALVKSLRLKQWAVDGEEFGETNGSVEEITELPHTETYWWGDDYVTEVAVQYETDGSYDGHFVMFENADAIAQQAAFVQTMIADGTPTLIAP